MNTWPLVCLVDDDPSAREVRRKQLEAAGFRVAEADCGDQAVNAIASASCSLCIVNLATSVGLAAIKELNRRFPELPIIAIGDDGMAEGHRLAALEHGSSAVVDKPWHRRELMELARALCAKPKTPTIGPTIN